MRAYYNSLASLGEAVSLTSRVRCVCFATGCSQDDIDEVKPHYRGKSTAQLAYKWVIQHGVSICMSADDSDHRVTAEFQEDMDMFDWTISDRDMSTLDAIGPTRPVRRVVFRRRRRCLCCLLLPPLLAACC